MTRDSRCITKELRGTAEEAQRRIRPLLEKLAARWGDSPRRLAQDCISFAARHPPEDHVASVLRTLLYGWCTRARFRHPRLACRFFDAPEGDAQQHYLEWRTLTAWVGQGLLYTTFPPEGGGHRCFLEELGGDAQRALKAAVVLDAAPFGFNPRRHGSLVSARAHVDARVHVSMYTCTRRQMYTCTLVQLYTCTPIHVYI